jgi:TetR/AcrR family transcriptional repressor of mexJK operon
VAALGGDPAPRGIDRKAEAILTAARELFLNEGFDRSSVDTVAARAGVSKRTVYDYFGDKHSLLQAVVTGISDPLVDGIRRTIDATLTGLTGLTDPARLEDALGAQLAVLADACLLTPDPRLAADHLIALTFGVASTGWEPSRSPATTAYDRWSSRASGRSCAYAGEAAVKR